MIIFLDEEYSPPSRSLITKPISDIDNSTQILTNPDTKTIYKNKIDSSEFKDSEFSNDLSNKMQSIHLTHQNKKKSEMTQDYLGREDTITSLQINPTTKSEIFQEFSPNDICDVDSLKKVAVQGRQPGIEYLIKDRLVKK